jgi:hypothetical protein
MALFSLLDRLSLRACDGCDILAFLSFIKSFDQAQ